MGREGIPGKGVKCVKGLGNTLGIQICLPDSMSSEEHLTSLQLLFPFGGPHPTVFYEINFQDTEGEGCLSDLVEVILEVIVILASTH